jgi:hypothetical protein
VDTRADKDKTGVHKEPLKVNVFEMARRGNTQLLPLFPYIGPGDIVPCCAVFKNDGSGQHRIGYFVHTNCVDEIALVMGGEGRRRTGDVFVGPRSHGVGGDVTTPFFAVSVITQRQLEQGDQPEAQIFQCEKCNTDVFKHEWGNGDDAALCAPLLPTVRGSLEATEAWNASAERRRCPKCAHENPPFPLQMWGWGQHVRATQITEQARKALEQAGRP